MARHKILLPMASPIIHGYTHYAHLLSILQCNNKTLPWIFSNFIQIYMYRDLQKTPWGDFYNPMQYDPSLGLKLFPSSYTFSNPPAISCLSLSS